MNKLKSIMSVCTMMCMMLITISSFAQSDDELFSKIKIGGKYGLMSGTGRVIIEPQYDELGKFSEGLISIRKGEIWGAIDKDNKEVIAPKYGDNFTFINGYALTTLPGKPGNVVIDKTGKVVLTMVLYTFPSFNGFKEGVEPIMDTKKNKVGFVNKANKVTFVPIYDEIFAPSEKLFKIRKGNLFGFCDKDGKIVVKTIYDDARSFKNGVSVVKQTTKAAIITPDGKFKVPLGTYNRILPYDDGTMRCVKGKLMGILDNKGDVLMAPTYENIGEFREGFATIMKENKFGLIDSTGKEILKPTYAGIGDVSNGLAEIIQGGKFGFIDVTGKVVIKPTFAVEDEMAHSFNNGVCIIKKAGKFGLIDRTGKIVAAPKYSEMIAIAPGLFRVMTGDKYGIVDTRDKAIVPIQYEEIGVFEK